MADGNGFWKIITADGNRFSAMRGGTKNGDLDHIRTVVNIITRFTELVSDDNIYSNVLRLDPRIILAGLQKEADTSSSKFLILVMNPAEYVSSCFLVSSYLVESALIPSIWLRWPRTWLGGP